jgi:hypothetical protein
MRDGEGKRGKPFRYWLPGKEEVWRQDPLAILHMPELLQQRHTVPTHHSPPTTHPVTNP